MELVIIVPRFTKRHPKDEFLSNAINLYSICEENHTIDKFSSLPGLKCLYQEEESGLEKLFFIHQRRPQGPHPYQQGMQDAHYPYLNPKQSAPFHTWYPPVHSSSSMHSPWPYSPHSPP